MSYNKKMNLCIGLLLVLLTACQGAKKEVETQTPRISVSEYTMLHEVVKIKLDNVAPDMEMTVDFGDGTVETGRNDGLLTHAYAKEGDYTIKAQTATGTLTAGIHVTITIVLYFGVKLQVLFDNNIGAVCIGLLVLSPFVFHLIS